ncbi:Deoxyguanosinetriphosphate triphosphohydrolase-like protein [Geodia barretti]|uniref:Deoxyguanosinetriphosphate triphosphohydrolase-like protein n=1 Tax=Geodia barretti TaxID=519541 RepID=A0AA35RBM8_GEOBA|nr:Deoxyguanosinetriphosphate triphosphohydrolase-like protein [Geodia barretti]
MPFGPREERFHNNDRAPDQRNPFQRDRDRIIYTSAFRRLAWVTQVVSAAEGEPFHNPLTHTLEVAQIGKRLAEKLVEEQPEEAHELGGVEPEVVEAAGLAHDLGHPPFGHAAERELDGLVQGLQLPDGFEGNPQSFRVVTKLAVRSAETPGLNLSRATLNAILKYPWFRHATPPNRHRK